MTVAVSEPRWLEWRWFLNALMLLKDRSIGIRTVDVFIGIQRQHAKRPDRHIFQSVDAKYKCAIATKFYHCIRHIEV